MNRWGEKILKQAISAEQLAVTCGLPPQTKQELTTLIKELNAGKFDKNINRAKVLALALGPGHMALSPLLATILYTKVLPQNPEMISLIAPLAAYATIPGLGGWTGLMRFFTAGLFYTVPRVLLDKKNFLSELRILGITMLDGGFLYGTMQYTLNKEGSFNPLLEVMKRRALNKIQYSLLMILEKTTRTWGWTTDMLNCQGQMAMQIGTGLLNLIFK